MIATNVIRLSLVVNCVRNDSFRMKMEGVFANVKARKWWMREEIDQISHDVLLNIDKQFKQNENST